MIMKMKEVRKIIERLIGEYTIESMSGEDVSISNMPETDDDLNVALMQKQYGTWCLQSKKFLISDAVSPLSKQGMVASYIKGKMSNYIKDTKTRDVMAMHYLYDSDKIDVLCQQISMLARHAIYKDVEDINNVPDETRKNSLAPETVSLYIGIYTLFTLIVNDNIEDDMYNTLFINAWFNYYKYWTSREALMQMRGNSWKDDFNNVLMA